MGWEIERKFLVRGDAWREQAGPGVVMRQGYLAGGGRSSVRLRLEGGSAQLNIKGATVGIQRLEFEYPIPAVDAACMLEELCDGPLVEKTRYPVTVGSHVWEVDCFGGANSGLVVAEVELSHPDEPFEMPAWAGPEVSHLPRYYNVSLVCHPYRDWSAAERRGE